MIIKISSPFHWDQYRLKSLYIDLNVKIWVGQLHMINHANSGKSFQKVVFGIPWMTLLCHIYEAWSYWILQSTYTMKFFRITWLNQQIISFSWYWCPCGFFFLFPVGFTLISLNSDIMSDLIQDMIDTVLFVLQLKARYLNLIYLMECWKWIQ